MPTPDIVSMEKITGSVTAVGVAAGGSAKQTITISGNRIIIGCPKVSTPTANAEVEVVNGGKNEFTVKAINLDTVNAQDIVINYEVYVLREV